MDSFPTVPATLGRILDPRSTTVKVFLSKKEKLLSRKGDLFPQNFSFMSPSFRLHLGFSCRCGPHLILLELGRAAHTAKSFT